MRHTTSAEQGIVVDVEDDPRARTANSGPGLSSSTRGTDGSRAGRMGTNWWWFGGGVALLALVVTTILLRPEPQEIYAPPVVVGLADEPSFAWELEIERHITTVTPVGDALAVHSSSWRGARLQFDLLDPADGSVLWSRDYAEHVTISPAAPVEVRDLPGTPHLAIAIVPSSTRPGIQTLIVERETGDLVSSEALAEGSFIASTDQGSYVVVDPADEFGTDSPVGEITLLDSWDPADALWQAAITDRVPSRYLNLREHGGYLGLGVGFPGMWFTGLDSVYLLDDGSPEFRSEEYGSAVFIADKLVVSRHGKMTALEVDSGDITWEKDCDCVPVEVAGYLFMLDRTNEIVDFMRIDPRNGMPMWDRAMDPGDLTQLVPLDDQLIIGTNLESHDDETWTSCFVSVDLRTGRVGPETCVDDLLFYAWSGEGQMLFAGAYNTLYAVVPGESEPQWRIELYEFVEWIDVVGSRLVVFDEVNGIVGVLG